jgi:predicted metal-dependent peptidase
MRNSSAWTSDKSQPKTNTVKQIKDDGDTSDQQGAGDGESEGQGGSEDGGLGDMTGGVDVKDLLFVSNKKDAMLSEEKTREIVSQALKQSSEKSRGYMHGDASQFIEAAHEQPVVPWYQRLNHIITSGISMDRRITKRRANRRNPDFGFGRVNENITTICFVIDTSGSMSGDDLSHVDAELAAIVQNTELPVNVIHCDAGVAKCEEYRRGMKMEQFWGRGGTSFEPALEYIRDELPETPDLLVYFTDGYGGRLNDDEPIIHPSQAELLWILTPRGMSEEHFRSSITEQGGVIKVEEWA